MNKELWAVWMAVVLAGCVAYQPPGAPLSPDQIGALFQSVAPLDQEAPGLSPRVTAAIPMNTRMFEPARFPIIRATVNGRLVLALVDTGSARSLIEYGAARRACVVPTGQGEVLAHGPGGSAGVFPGVAGKVAIGRMSIHAMPMGIVNRAQGLESLAWLDGFRVEALIGNDLLARLAWARFDYRREEVTLSTDPAARPEGSPTGVAIPLTATYPLQLFQASFDGIALFPVALDTGGDFGLWIPRQLAETLRLPELLDTRKVQMGLGFGGETVFVPAEPRALRAGGIALKDVPILISMLNLGDADPPCAFLGAQAFRGRVVTVDYARKFVFLDKL